MKKTTIQEMISKCINNNINVYPVPFPLESSKGLKNPNCKIHINIRGVVKVLEDVHKQDSKLYNKIEETYKELYNDNFN